MKDALIVEILSPLWDVHDVLKAPGDRMRMKQAIDSVKKDLETFIGDSLDPD
jgi:hypothetical protein